MLPCFGILVDMLLFNLNAIAPGVDTLERFWPVFLVLVVWELAWKGVALWKAASYRQTGWFVAILILNTIGILPIVYILFFQAKRGEETSDH